MASNHTTDPEAAMADSQSSQRGIAAIRGGALRVTGYVVGVLVSLGTVTILVRHLGVTNFGRYITVTSLIGLVGAFTEAGIYSFGIREFVFRDEAHHSSLLANLLGMRLVLTAFGVGLALCFAIAVGYREVMVIGALVAGGGLLAQVAADVLSVPLQVQLRFGRLTAVELTRRLVALLLVALLATAGAGIVPLLGAASVGAVVALCLLASVVRSDITIGVSFDLQSWRDLLRETLPFAAAVSIGAIYFFVTVILMSLIASATQTGYFATAFRVMQVALAIPSLLLTAVFPLISAARRDGREGTRIAGKVFTVAAICGVWMSLAMALGASFIIDVIAGNKGHGSISVLRIQGLVLAASFISASSIFGLLSLRRYRSILITTAGALALNILLGVVLVSALGARGGALADVASEAVVAVVLTAVLMRAEGEHEISLHPIPRIGLAAAIAATVLLLPIGAIPRVVCASLIYFGVVFATRTVPDEVLVAARRFRTIRTPSS